MRLARASVYAPPLTAGALVFLLMNVLESSQPAAKQKAARVTGKMSAGHWGGGPGLWDLGW